ncbi:MAG: DUF3189 family protein [Bacillota bacterium]
MTHYADVGSTVIVGQTREAAFAAHEDRFGHAPIAREGRSGFAARIGRAYLLWGVVPSPLAVKVAENVLSLYEGDGGRGAAHEGAAHEGAADGGAANGGAVNGGAVAPPNRIFYACYAGTHSSVLAASLHLGRVKDGDDLCDLPFFDRRESKDIGVPVRIGIDAYGSEVYAMGTGWLSARVEKPLCDLIEVASPNAKACICSVRGFLDVPARCGGFASRRCRMVWPGRQIIAASLGRRIPDMQEAVRRCLDLSRRWKDNEGQQKGEVVWINGAERGRDRPGGQ